MRLHRAWLQADTLDEPDLAEIIEALAREDAEVMCSLGARRWWLWFDRGWADYSPGDQ